MFKNVCWIIGICLLSFNVLAEPTEDQLYPAYGYGYGPTTGRVLEQYPYTQLPTQVYPSSVRSQDYYPYGQQSTQIYYNEPASASSDCACRRGW